MKNILRSLLCNRFNSFSRPNFKTLSFICFVVLILTSNYASAQLPITYNFESGFQGWTSNASNGYGNDDSGTYNGWGCNAYRSIYSKDDDGSNNIMMSPAIDLTSYSEVTISFCHKSININNNKGFRLQYYDGSNWTTIKHFRLGTDFFTQGFYEEHSFSRTINDGATYVFTANSRFRFRGTSSDNNDWNFFDDVTITGLNNTPCTQPTNQPTNLTFSNTSNDAFDISFNPATSSPDNYLVVYNTTGTTPTITDGTTYNTGSTFSGNTVLSNNTDTSFSLTGLTPDETYYFYVFSYNSDCLGGPNYLNNSPLSGNETTDLYCIPYGSNTSNFIRDFSTTGGVANITNLNTGYSTGGYGDFTSNFATQAAGTSINFTADFSGGNHGFGIWVDYNNDGDFTDPGEQEYISGFYDDPISGSFTIPATTAVGSYRMRIIADYWDRTPQPCSISYNRGEAEDYTLNVTPQLPCSEPTNQPTNLTFSNLTETTMDVSFTAATSAPDNYLVLVNTTGVAPTITDGTTYTTGTTFSGNTVLSTNSSTSFSLSSLTDNTTYYFYVFSYNSEGCSGGPIYLITSPLNDNETTIAFCTPSTGLGTTSLSCPSVDAGGLGLSGADPDPINCSVGSNTTTLEATYLNLGDTSTYNVESIPYSPPFQFNCLANPVSVNDDDVWSPEIDLPFDFCFFGNTYDSCVIGSNGVISFDTSLASTTTYSSPTGWRTINDLPSTENTTGRYYGPSIYGVHHDVDPSVGGEIGYQLITLDTGCRALVAAWSDVPMFDDNSLLYTGMIVFYEDTNIIEVYIKEKRALNAWNDGNASVGLQGNETTAVVAPGRNTRDANWTAFDEAWRFVPAGPTITTLKWYQNSISAANEIIDPDNDGIITVTPSVTTTYFSEVTYNLCSGSNIIEIDSATITLTGDKIWDGSESSDWNDADNWTPAGVPVITDCIVIPVTPNDPIITGTVDGNGFNMEIEDGATLTQQSNSSLTIDDKITIETNADYELKDSASLIQIINVATNQNIGTAKVEREVAALTNFDYVYWSTPVESFNVADVSPSTPYYGIFEWLPTVDNGSAGKHGEWSYASGNMALGQGYAIRDLEGTPLADNAVFEGKINNGQITHYITRGVYNGNDYTGIGNTSTAEDDNWNLMGNPYPSAISLTAFTSANPYIDGTLYFWRHTAPPSTSVDDPFYEGFLYNYSENDYLSANSLGSTPPGFNGYIASGQGFFVQLLNSSPRPSGIVFNNSMRGAYSNDVFYRGTNDNTDTETVADEKHRIWLDLIDSNDKALSILVGYASGATDDIDRLFDGYLLNDTSYQFYSILNDTEKENKLSINGKALPFDTADIIPLGYQAPAQGQFTIALNTVDGLFAYSDQNIYLEDTELNIIHDLKANPYIFTTELGVFKERFLLRFTSETLSIADQDIINNVDIRALSQTIEATSTQSFIKTFELFDITGRLIHKKLNVENTNYSYPTNNLSSGTYVVTVSLANGGTLSKKVMVKQP